MNIIVSACLIGAECRYNGTSAANEIVIRYTDHDKINLIPVCPEVLGGLPTPRVPCEMAGDRVIGKDGWDYTAQFEQGAEETLKLAQKYDCKYAILKERSPSCGCGQIYDGTFTGKLVDGSGVTAELLSRCGVKIISETGAEELLTALADACKEVP